MKLINNYLTKNILYPTISIITILSFIILLTQSLKYINLVVTHGISALDFLYLSTLLIPGLLSIIIPICLFIAMTYSLNKLSSYRELNVLKSFGISNYNISKPILKVALIVTLFHYGITLYLMPKVNHKFKDFSLHLKEGYINFFLQERVFNHPTNDITFYIKKKIGNNKFEDIFFQDDRNENPVVIVAKFAELLKIDNGLFLDLKDGSRQEINQSNELNVLHFEKLLWQISKNINQNDSRTLSIQEQSLKDLLFNDLAEDSSLKKRMIAEANHRLTLPFYNIILTLLAIMALLQGEFSRTGKTKRIIFFSIIGGLSIIINTSLINLSANYSEVIILSYIFTIGLFLTLSYILFCKDY